MCQTIKDLSFTDDLSGNVSCVCISDHKTTLQVLLVLGLVHKKQRKVTFVVFFFVFANKMKLTLLSMLAQDTHFQQNRRL